jgi:Alpha 1,4-glycosyltransferase conserved region
MLPTCNSLWIGARLGRLERACLRSVLARGHALRLWCYDPPEGVPEGVALADAATILPRERIVAHASGSVALFANHFRYRLQSLGLGLWIDADVYLLAPLADLPDTLFGRVDGAEINNAVLCLPPDSPLLPPLLALFEERTVPPWLGRRAGIAARWRLLRTGRSRIDLMPWGSAGPHALTWLARRHGLAGAALPPEVFYPFHWRDAGWILDPARSLDEAVTARTRAVHLWNERIKAVKEGPAPAGSFLARLQAEGA